VGQLRKSHAQKLIPAGKRSDPLLGVVALYAPLKFLMGEELHQLRKNRATLVHPSFLSRNHSNRFTPPRPLIYS
jgi:hypothetical protein